ncbi:MAG: MotA/TolQ/ExbB proton channel family protein [Planctomyces sp.]|nr:MotA/TolQ/ExbB proton channel family protein [Planctomyces sp.]
MDVTTILTFAENAIWLGIALCAIFGMFFIILLWRRVSQKRFPSLIAERTFVDAIAERLDRGDFEAVTKVCDTPEVWAKAIPQLTMVAVENRSLPMKKIRQLVGQRFERDILSSFEHTGSWVGTMVKIAPMLGLLGTVVGMINAFGKIAAAATSGINPAALAGDISFALWTTAAGLLIAVPLVTLGSAVSVRIAKLQDAVSESLGQILDDIEAAKMRTDRR